MALVLPALENQVSDKRVESILFPRLDEGSSPSWSTKEALIISVIQICSDKKSDKLRYYGHGFVLLSNAMAVFFMWRYHSFSQHFVLDEATA